MTMPVLLLAFNVLKIVEIKNPYVIRYTLNGTVRYTMLMSFNGENFYHDKVDTKYAQDEITAWVNREINPTHLMTVQFPANLKTSNLFTARERLRRIMKSFEYFLVGRYWHVKPVEFIAFAEHGLSTGWHFHIPLNLKCNPRTKEHYTEKQIDDALSSVWNTYELNRYSLHMLKLEETPERAVNYCTKELTANMALRIDSDRIITSRELFDIKPCPMKHMFKEVYRIETKGIKEFALRGAVKQVV